ncbi:MAG: nitroreductase/quinone reductase family protein [Candidatus Limnocylindria bacterium]
MPVEPLSRRTYLAIGEVLTHRWFHPIHRRLYRLTGGRGIASRALDMDMVLVTMVGRRSGTARTIPLAAVLDGPGWILVASNAGKARMPDWAHNLRADGAVTVEHRRGVRPFTAREVTDPEEYEARWQQAVAAYPGYAVYRARTARAIPLFVLEPSAQGGER